MIRVNTLPKYFAKALSPLALFGFLLPSLVHATTYVGQYTASANQLQMAPIEIQFEFDLNAGRLSIGAQTFNATAGNFPGRVTLSPIDILGVSYNDGFFSTTPASSLQVNSTVVAPNGQRFAQLAHVDTGIHAGKKWRATPAAVNRATITGGTTLAATVFGTQISDHAPGPFTFFLSNVRPLLPPVVPQPPVLPPIVPPVVVLPPPVIPVNPPTPPVIPPVIPPVVVIPIFPEPPVIPVSPVIPVTPVTPPSTEVPEPASLALLGSALIGAGVARKRRKDEL